MDFNCVAKVRKPDDASYIFHGINGIVNAMFDDGNIKVNVALLCARVTIYAAH